MNDVVIMGYSQTKFGKFKERTPEDLATQAIYDVITSSGIDTKDIGEI